MTTVLRDRIADARRVAASAKCGQYVCHALLEPQDGVPADPDAPIIIRVQRGGPLTTIVKGDMIPWIVRFDEGQQVTDTQLMDGLNGRLGFAVRTDHGPKLVVRHIQYRREGGAA